MELIRKYLQRICTKAEFDHFLTSEFAPLGLRYREPRLLAVGCIVLF